MCCICCIFCICLLQLGPTWDEEMSSLKLSRKTSPFEIKCAGHSASMQMARNLDGFNLHTHVADALYTSQCVLRCVLQFVHSAVCSVSCCRYDTHKQELL